KSTARVQVGEGADEVHDEGVPTVGVAEGAASVADDEVPAAVDEPSIQSPTPLTPPPQQSQDQPSNSYDKITQDLEITKLKQRVKKLERMNKLKVLKLMKLKKIDKSADVQGRKAESQAQIYQIDLEHANKVLSMQDDEVEPAELQEVVEVVTTTKLITEVVTAASATITAAAPQLTIVAAPTLTTTPSAARRRKGVAKGDADEMHVEDVNAAGVVTEGVFSATDDVAPTTDEEPSIPSHTPPTPPPPPLPSHDIPFTSQVQPILPQSPQEIENIDADEDVVLEDAKDVAANAKDGPYADIDESVDIQGRTADTTITAVDVPIPVATTAAAPTLTAALSRRTKGVVIRDPKESTTTSIIIHSEAKSKLKIYQALKRKPQTEAQARKNLMVYLKNVAGFKMDYFKGMTYDDIRPIFEKHFNSNVAFLQNTKEQMDEQDNRALKRLNESNVEKAAKKQKLDEEVEELKRHLQIVPNDDDDVYTEATTVACKVPIVDYKIYNENNKPYFKIKRAD
nr:hypothetical protein [Tanacetum cinerariifolium]